MDLMWAIYFIDVLTSEGGHAVLGCLALGVYAFVSALFFMELCGTKEEYSKWPTKTVVSISLAFIVYGSLMPSKDTAYKMLAAYGVTEIAQNEKVQELGGKSLEVLEKAMDDYLSEEKSK